MRGVVVSKELRLRLGLLCLVWHIPLGELMFLLHDQTVLTFSIT
jgi:hypothetical protein